MDKPAANADGSIDIYFSPTSPGVGRNWLRTIPDKDYFVALRLYGQLRPSSIKLGEQTIYRKYNDSQPLTGRTEVSKRHLWDQAAMSAFGTTGTSDDVCFSAASG
jgi:hypothetical protein